MKISACREIHRLHDDGRCDSWAAKVKVDGGRVRASCESRRPKRSALPTIDRAPSRTNSSTCRHPSGRRIINFRDCKLNCFLPLVRTVQRAARPKTSSTRVETRRYRQCVSVTAVISSPPPPTTAHAHHAHTPTRPHAHTPSTPSTGAPPPPPLQDVPTQSQPPPPPYTSPTSIHHCLLHIRPTTTLPACIRAGIASRQSSPAPSWTSSISAAAASRAACKQSCPDSTERAWPHTPLVVSSSRLPYCRNLPQLGTLRSR